ESGELFVVGGGALDGPGEDRRVGRHPPDAVTDEATQGPVLEVEAAEIVEPGALAELSEEALQLSHGGVTGQDCASGRTGAARSPGRGRQRVPPGRAARLGHRGRGRPLPETNGRPSTALPRRR